MLADKAFPLWKANERLEMASKVQGLTVGEHTKFRSLLREFADFLLGMGTWDGHGYYVIRLILGMLCPFINRLAGCLSISETWSKNDPGNVRARNH